MHTKSNLDHVKNDCKVHNNISRRVNFRYRKYKMGTQDGYGCVPGCCVLSSYFTWHRCHIKHTPKQCKRDRLKSKSKRDMNEMSTCAVPVHAPQASSLWRGVGGGQRV